MAIAFENEPIMCQINTQQLTFYFKPLYHSKMERDSKRIVKRLLAEGFERVAVKAIASQVPQRFGGCRSAASEEGFAIPDSARSIARMACWPRRGISIPMLVSSTQSYTRKTQSHRLHHVQRFQNHSSSGSRYIGGRNRAGPDVRCAQCECSRCRHLLSSATRRRCFGRAFINFSTRSANLVKSSISTLRKARS